MAPYRQNIDHLMKNFLIYNQPVHIASKQICLFLFFSLNYKHIRMINLFFILQLFFFLFLSLSNIFFSFTLYSQNFVFLFVRNIQYFYFFLSFSNFTVSYSLWGFFCIIFPFLAFFLYFLFFSFTFSVSFSFIFLILFFCH